VVFPGGFGTLDELSELLTLTQTRKLEKEIIILLYGTSFWKEILNIEALARYGMISPGDLNLFHYADDVESAFNYLRDGLTRVYLEPESPFVPPLAEEEESPAIARSRT
jgi:predicted Rossmann-fold nucleotide-binding protein